MGRGQKGLKAGRAGVKGSEVRKGMVPPMSLSRNASEAGVLEGRGIPRRSASWGSGDSHLGSGASKGSGGMLVSLVRCQRLPASLLGCVLGVGPTPSCFMDGWLTEHLEPPLSAWITVVVSEWTQAG